MIRIGKARTLADSGLKTGNRISRSPQARVNDAQIAMAWRIARLAGQRFLEMLNRHVELAFLRGNQSEAVQGVRLGGVGLEDFLAQRFGGVEIAGGVQLFGAF